MPRLLPCLAALVLMTCPATPLAAQRSVTLLRYVGNATGHARDDADPDRPTITPDHPVAWEVAAAQAHGAWRGALRLRHAQAALAIRGASSAVLTRAAVRTWSLGVEAGRRIAGDAGVPALYLLLGLATERATFPVTGGDARTIVVTRLALEGTVPLAPQWQVVGRGEAGRSGSLFRSEELPPGYAGRAGRQWSVGVGLGWRP